MTRLSVVVPAYREERLPWTVGTLVEGLEPEDFELIIVTDHPDDPTTGAAEELAGGRVRHIAHGEPLGKGGAVLEGFREAEGEVVGFVDSDMPVSLDDVLRLAGEAERHGGAIASRNMDSSSVTRDRSATRRLASRAFNLYVRALFGLPFRDTQCGAKFFRSDALEEVVPRMECTGFEFDVELLWRLSGSGVDVAEVPVTWEHTEESTFSLAEGPEMLLRLLRLRGKGLIP